MSEAQGIPVFAHFHPCESRWHALAQFDYGPSPDKTQRATFHDWDKDKDAAIARCAQMARMWLERQGHASAVVRNAAG